MDDSPLASKTDNSRNEPSVRKISITLGAIVLVLVTGLALLGIFLLRNPALTRRLRDLVIIAFALEMIVIGIAVIVVMVQLARLLHLMRHEIKPILEQANDTIVALRSIARLVSDNVAAPVVKLGGTLAGALRFLILAGKVAHWVLCGAMSTGMGTF